ncbi:hypothetical protein M3181_14970 [Mesobacillus maritimus]|uniref:hypothetical protein n=1 Tax=Mesobacillus maritimus TaxID=1643336 RepID=UPI00203F4F0F|nr:hypothetical protein [Mesobacillus maritimus]MCM3670283.1 hypothetical protein [Mesobacillus maritimus]
MKNNFLNILQYDQEVLVFGDYHFFKDMALEDYPFDSLLDREPRFSFSDVHIGFWKKHLKEEFIIEKNFHLDFLERTSETSKKKWADYKRIALNDLITILRRNEKVEEETNQREEDEVYYRMKEESLFNDPLRFGVTPEGMLKISNTYKLQDAHSLYTEIAKLEVFDFESLLRFSKHFGLPSGIMDDRGFEFILDGYCIFFPFGSISVLNKKIAIYKQDFEWFKLIQTKNIPKIRSLLPNSNLIDDEEVIGLAKSRLADLLSKLDAFQLSTHLDYQSGSFIPTVWFSDLFNFAYFQLAKALSNNVEVRECEFCGHIFEVTHKRQRFCPALPNRKRSSCEMANNNRLKKEKKQQREI